MTSSQGNRFLLAVKLNLSSLLLFRFSLLLDFISAAHTRYYFPRLRLVLKLTVLSASLNTSPIASFDAFQ